MKKSGNFSVTRNGDKNDVLQKTNKGMTQEEGKPEKTGKNARPNSFMRSGNQN